MRVTLSIITEVRHAHRDNKIRYRRSLQANRMLVSLSMRWVQYDDCMCKSADKAAK